MKQVFCRRNLISCLTWLGMICLWQLPAAHPQSDEFRPAATWYVRSTKEIIAEFSVWMDEASISLDSRSLALRKLQSGLEKQSGDPLAHVFAALAEVRPQVAELKEVLSSSRRSVPKTASDLVDQTNAEMFVVDHMRLYLGVWLARREFYDEALEQFERLSLSRVLAPGSLLFYKSICQHQLVHRQEGLATAKRLLENADQLPDRYATLGRLMVADLEPLKTDSLNEISRLMNDIRRRQALSRAGKRVIGQEQAVLEKLDKLIESIEQQQQAAQQQQSSSQGAPPKPMQDSQSLAGRGDGSVRPKDESDGGNWGNLPPRERAAALAEMAKDLPPHYRAVIEEYFRKLAKDDDR